MATYDLEGLQTLRQNLLVVLFDGQLLLGDHDDPDYGLEYALGAFYRLGDFGEEQAVLF